MPLMQKLWKALVCAGVLCLIMLGTHGNFRTSLPHHTSATSQAQAAAFADANQNACVASLSPQIMRVPGGVIDITFAPGRFDVPEATVLAWVRRAAIAVSTYYGHFPVRHARVRIVPVEGEKGIFHGTTYGEGGGFTRIPVGEHVTTEQLDRDWIMTHEFVHLSFPDMPRQHAWIEEGLATYVEPIARVQARQLKAAGVWSDLVRDMPQGEPQAGDEGLDYTHTWARTYWGGALYCLQADLRIRQLTKNQKGLQDALRAIVAAGGTLDKEDWQLEQALRIGDQATGTHVLEELYAEMKAQPVAVDLPQLWKKLGVTTRGGQLVFDNDAQWAAARLAITGSPQAPPTTVASNREDETAAENESRP